MYTFNLAIVFGAGEGVATIVCASESPIDQEAVHNTAQQCFLSLPPTTNAKKAISHISRSIQEECDCQVVNVYADAAIIVHKKPLK